jgi:hypothetical protein
VKLAAGLSLFFALLGGVAVASTRTAHVSVLSIAPVSVRGNGFRANERVAVTVTANATRTKRVIAGARGNFRITFRSFSIEFCVPYTVRAKGNRGSRAVLRVIPDCAPTGPGDEPDPGLPTDPLPKKR